MAEPVALGPWPLGVDNVHPVRHQVFQLPGQGQPPARLAVATDVELSDEGWPRTRPLVASTALTVGQGIESVAGRLFYQDDGSLYEHGNATALVMGLVARAALAEFGGRIFGSDGTTHFELDGTTVRVWGLPAPTIALSATAGSTFSAGTYIVQCVFTDGRNEGPTSKIVAISLASASDIQVSVTGLDSRVTGIHLFVGKDKQSATSYARTITTSGTSAQVFLASVPTTVNDPPRTEQMHGPVQNLSGLFSFRAFLMMYRDGVLWRSQASEPHLFHAKTLYQTGETIHGGGESKTGTSSGFWLGTTRGIWWFFGNEPPFVGTCVAPDLKCLKGAFVVDASQLSFLQASGTVVLFVTQYGLVAGTADGTLIPITRDRYHVDLDTYSNAHFAYVERADVRQLLVSLS